MIDFSGRLLVDQNSWYESQGVTREYMITCTNCGKKEVAIHYCTDTTHNKHVNLCFTCNNLYHKDPSCMGGLFKW